MPIESTSCLHGEFFMLGMFVSLIVYFWARGSWSIVKKEKDSYRKE
jgi:hypothetical protein